MAMVIALGGTLAAVVATRGLSSPGLVDRITDVRGVQGCPKWSPNGRVVLYATGLPGDQRVEITNVATGASRAVASGSDPAWSPDGGTVVFVYRHALVVVDAHGGHRRRLVAMRGAVHTPTWSPDGTTVAFAATSHADGRIRLAFVDARSGKVRLTAVDPVLDPAFSPDGRRVAYDTNDDIMLVDPDGAAPRLAFRGGGVSATGPSWSPDGHDIAFAAQSIYIGRPSTGDATRVTHPDTRAQVDDQCPAWSPDGRRIAFLRSQYHAAGLETVTDSAIVVAQADGSHQRLLGGA